MGCGASSQSPEHEAIEVQPQQRTDASVCIVLAGEAGAGKSSLAHRVVNKRWQASQKPFVVGTTCIRVHHCQVAVTLINGDKASAAELQRADAVMYTVRGDAEEPFSGVYSPVDKLYRFGTPALRKASLKSQEDGGSVTGSMRSVGSSRQMGKVLPWTPLGVAGDVCARTLESSVSGAGSVRSVSVNEPDVLARTYASHASHASEPLADREASPQPTKGPAVGWAKVAAAAPLNLTLDTQCGATMDEGFHTRVQPLSEDATSPDTSPMSVVVTACDLLEREDVDPLVLDRLRAMASNWSLANRCRVTFVSAKEDVGVRSALHHLVKLVLKQRLLRVNPAAAPGELVLHEAPEAPARALHA